MPVPPAGDRFIESSQRKGTRFVYAQFSRTGFAGNNQIGGTGLNHA